MIYLIKQGLMTHNCFALYGMKLQGFKTYHLQITYKSLKAATKKAL